MLPASHRTLFLGLLLVLNVIILSNYVLSETEEEGMDDTYKESDAIHYQIVAKFEKGYTKQPFYFDSGSSMDLVYSNLHFSGQYAKVGHFYFVTIESSALAAPKFKDTKSYLAIPTIRSHDVKERLDYEFMEAVIEIMKSKPSTPLSLSVPPFFFVNKHTYPDYFSMCMSEKMVDEPSTYVTNGFKVTLNSGFHYLIVNERTGEIWFQEYIQNFVPNPESCATIAQNVKLLRRLSYGIHLPISSISILNTLHANVQLASSLSLLTSFSLFPVLPDHELSRMYKPVTENQVYLYGGPNFSFIREILRFLNERGIFIQNEFLLNIDIPNREQLESILHEFSYTLIEPTKALSETEKKKETLRDLFYSYEEYTALDKLKSGEYRVPNTLLQPQVYDFNMALINIVSLQFEFKFKFDLGERKAKFHGASGDVDTHFFYVNAELRYIDDDPDVFAVELPIITTHENVPLKGSIYLIQMKYPKEKPYSAEILKRVDELLRDTAESPYTVGIPAFKIQEHVIFKRDDFPQLDVMNSKLAPFFALRELDQLHIMQSLHTTIHQDGASSDPTFKFFGTLDERTLINFTFDSPFYVAMYCQVSHQPLLSLPIDEVVELH